MNAKQLVQKLRGRCFREFGSEKDIVKRYRAARIGETFVEIGPAFAGHTHEEDEWHFEVSGVEKVANTYSLDRGLKTLWACKIHVTQGLDVLVEEMGYDVPRHVLACALGGV